MHSNPNATAQMRMSKPEYKPKMDKIETATLEDLIQDYKDIANRKNILIPYNLHDGLRRIQDLFGSASKAMDWFHEYRRDRHIK